MINKNKGYRPPVNVMERLTNETTFEDWLLMNYKETLSDLEIKVLRIGTTEDYRKCETWYRKRYQEELRKVRELKQITIKQYMEELNHGKQS